MVAMREEDQLQAWNAGNDIKQIMDQGDGRVVIILQLREVVKCSKADIVTKLRPMLPEMSVGDVTDLVQVAPKNVCVCVCVKTRQWRAAKEAPLLHQDLKSKSH